MNQLKLANYSGMAFRIFILIASIASFQIKVIVAQVSAIDKQKIDKLLAEATIKGQGRSIRTTESLLEFRDTNKQKPNYTSEATTEFLPPDRARAVLITMGDSVDTRFEVIQVGVNCYHRFDNNPWGASSDCQEPPFVLKLSGEMPENPSAVERYEWVGEHLLNGVLTNYFRTTRLAEGKGPDGDMDHLMVDNYYFDKNGLLVKQQNTWTWSKGKKLQGRREKTLDYQYNLKNLKIEAPIK